MIETTAGVESGARVPATARNAAAKLDFVRQASAAYRTPVD
jgi:hypothetical protein